MTTKPSRCLSLSFSLSLAGPLIVNRPKRKRKACDSISLLVSPPASSEERTNRLVERLRDYRRMDSCVFLFSCSAVVQKKSRRQNKKRRDLSYGCLVMVVLSCPSIGGLTREQRPADRRTGQDNHHKTTVTTRESDRPIKVQHLSTNLSGRFLSFYC